MNKAEAGSGGVDTRGGEKKTPRKRGVFCALS